MMNTPKLLPAFLIALSIAAPLHAQRGRRGGGGEVVTVDPAKAATIKGKVVLDGSAEHPPVLTQFY